MEGAEREMGDDRGRRERRGEGLTGHDGAEVRMERRVEN